jgi:intracellular sulfur oxidation DsrE/DsrF family protein
MRRFAPLATATAACVAALFLMTEAGAQTREPAAPSVATAGKKSGEQPARHRLVLQVNTNDAAAMNLALNNAANVEQYYKAKGEPVEIEIVTFGPGLNMLRDDTSPVKDRIKSIAESRPSITFKACGNTQENMAKAENKTITLVPQASLVSSGVVRVMELQEQGWSYVRP